MEKRLNKINKSVFTLAIGLFGLFHSIFIYIFLNYRLIDVFSEIILCACIGLMVDSLINMYYVNKVIK